MTSLIEQTTRAARKAGLGVVDRGNGHLQITGGALLVNYYPTSKSRTAYVAGTRDGRKNVTPEQAVRMALTAPPIAPDKAQRKKQRAAKLRMLKRDPHCHWCRCALDDKTATVDHVIPLSRGGLDNDNNRVLACQPCNHARGNSMPEIKQSNKEKAA